MTEPTTAPGNGPDFTLSRQFADFIANLLDYCTPAAPTATEQLLTELLDVAKQIRDGQRPVTYDYRGAGGSFAGKTPDRSFVDNHGQRWEWCGGLPGTWAWRPTGNASAAAEASAPTPPAGDGSRSGVETTAPTATPYTVQDLGGTDNEHHYLLPDGSMCAAVWDRRFEADGHTVMLFSPNLPSATVRCFIRSQADALADLHARMCARVIAAEAAQ